MVNFTYLNDVFDLFSVTFKSGPLKIAENKLDNTGLVEGCLKKTCQIYLFAHFNTSS